MRSAQQAATSLQVGRLVLAGCAALASCAVLASFIAPQPEATLPAALHAGDASPTEDLAAL